MSAWAFLLLGALAALGVRWGAEAALKRWRRRGAAGGDGVEAGV